HDREIRPRWERKWAWAQANCGRPNPLAYLILTNEGQMAPEQSFRTLTEREWVCLALGYPPGRPHGLSRDEISVGLQAGFPLMLWCRKGERRVISEYVTPLITLEPLLELPTLVAQRRA